MLQLQTHEQDQHDPDDYESIIESFKSAEENLFDYINDHKANWIMYAHLLDHTIAGHKFYMVIITPHADMIPYRHYNGVFVRSISEAFDVAASHNAPLMQGGNELIQGNFS